MRQALAALGALGIMLVTEEAPGQGSFLRKPVQELVEAIGKWSSKQAGRNTAAELAEAGGEAAARRVGRKLIAEGGEEALERATRLTAEHGGAVLRAADNLPNPARALEALEELPAEQASVALARLAAGAEGRVLAQTAEKWGAAALRAEVSHPGIGGRLVSALGDDGAELAIRAGRDDAIMMARYADEIARLPASQRAGIVTLLHQDTERMVAFLGRFAEKNPGKVLFSASATTIILANPEAVLGEGEIVFDTAGNPVFVAKPGLIERGLVEPVKKVVGDSVRAWTSWLFGIIVVGAAGWMGVKLWFHYRRAKAQHVVAIADIRAAGARCNPSPESRDERTEA